MLPTYVISLLVILKKLQKKRKFQKGFRVEKVIERKGHKLYVKWKSYDDCFNSWIDKKRQRIN